MQKGNAPILGMLGLVLLIFAGYGIYLGYIYVSTFKERVEYYSRNKKDEGSAYSVLFPPDFYINYKTDYNLMISKSSKNRHGAPYAGLEVYGQAIPRDYSLRQWVEAVSTKEYDSFEAREKNLCKDALDKLHESQEADFKYGGAYGRTIGDQCLFFGIDNIRDTQINALEYSEDSEAIEFEVYYGEGTMDYETHTLATFGTGSVWDIYKASSILNDPDVDRAYKLMRESFKFE